MRILKSNELSNAQSIEQKQFSANICSHGYKNLYSKTHTRTKTWYINIAMQILNKKTKEDNDYSFINH